MRGQLLLIRIVRHITTAVILQEGENNLNYEYRLNIGAPCLLNLELPLNIPSINSLCKATT